MIRINTPVDHRFFHLSDLKSQKISLKPSSSVYWFFIIASGGRHMKRNKKLKRKVNVLIRNYPPLKGFKTIYI